MSCRTVILSQQRSVWLDLETGHQEGRALRLSEAGLRARDAISVHPVPAAAVSPILSPRLSSGG
jgi:hypothetical protein